MGYEIGGLSIADLRTAIVPIARGDPRSTPANVCPLRAVELVGRSIGMFGESEKRNHTGLWKALAFYAAQVTDARHRALMRVVKGRKCGAKTRTGLPCQCRVEPGRARCRFHGGKSTGAKTPEGKRRSLAALQEGHRRWAAQRIAVNSSNDQARRQRSLK
jgi:hypothetical protein